MIDLSTNHSQLPLGRTDQKCTICAAIGFPLLCLVIDSNCGQRGRRPRCLSATRQAWHLPIPSSFTCFVTGAESNNDPGQGARIRDRHGGPSVTSSILRSRSVRRRTPAESNGHRRMFPAWAIFNYHQTGGSPARGADGRSPALPYRPGGSIPALIRSEIRESTSIS